MQKLDLHSIFSLLLKKISISKSVVLLSGIFIIPKTPINRTSMTVNHPNITGISTITKKNNCLTIVETTSLKKRENLFNNTQNLPVKKEFFNNSKYASLQSKYDFTKINATLQPPVSKAVVIQKRWFHQVSPDFSQILMNLQKQDTALVTVPPSPFMLKGMTHNLTVQGCLTGAFIICIQEGMPVPEAILAATMLIGQPGINFTMLQTISGGTSFFPKSITMLDHFPDISTVSQEVTHKIATLKMTQIMFFYETSIMSIINQQITENPFDIYNTNKHSITKNTENLTSNPCPDFIRQFKNPIGQYSAQMYDQKAIGGSFLPYNHIRPIQDNVEVSLQTAKKTLHENISFWLLQEQDNLSSSSMYDKKIAYKLLNQLTETRSLVSYNKLREFYDAFLIRNRIPMNLVVEGGLTKFPLDKKVTEYFKDHFFNLMYKQNSSWCTFSNSFMKTNNGPILKEGKFLQLFRDFIIKKN